MKGKFKLIKKYVLREKKKIILLFFITIIICLVSVFEPIITAKLLASITELKVELIKKYIIYFIFISIFGASIYYFNDLIFHKIKQKVLYNIRKDMIGSILNLKTVNFDNTTSGEFQEKLRSDPDTISTVLQVVQNNLLNIITSICIIGYISYINIYLGLIYLFGVILTYLVQRYYFKKYELYFKRGKKFKEKNNTILNEIMRGIRDIKVLNIGRQIKEYASDALDKNTKNDSKTKLQYSKVFTVKRIMTAIVESIVVMVGVIFIIKKKISLTNFLIIYMYRWQVFDLMYSLGEIKEYLIEYNTASERILSLFNNNIFSKEEYGDIELNNCKGIIKFNKLNFSYNDKKKILKDISFKVNSNQTIAIVGESGSGKTTILNLLTKNYDVLDNSIFIDDIDINKLTKDSIRNNISYITQNPYIFNLTIKDNFTLLDSTITLKEIKEACKIARIDDYIESLPDKYNTLLGEGGVSLSGGQKQRIAIARALLKKSKIILFDEATSALDNITQNEIQEAINNISNDYTIIIVAHRLSTIKNCDKIFVLHEGKIVGKGNHYQLLNNNKYYKKLYETEIKK